jgi:Mg2+-importing ATPase
MEPPFRLDDALREKVRSMIQAYSLKGFRVIAVAQKTNPSAVGAFSIADEKDMVLIGYLIFFDPPKESTAAVLKKLSDYGVEVKVLTGDTPEVTQYIAGLVGLKNTKTLLGKDVEAMDDTALQGVVESTAFSRSSRPKIKPGWSSLYEPKATWSVIWAMASMTPRP